MKPNFDLQGSQGFILRRVLPPKYRGFILPGSKVLAAEGERGAMLLQGIEHPHFQICFQVFNFLEPVKLAAHQNAAMLLSLLALKNNICYSIKGLGTLQLNQGQFALLHCREQDVVAHFEKDEECQALIISWSSEILRQALPYFNFLDAVFSPVNADKSFYLQTPGQDAGLKALDLVRDILKAPYDDALCGLYFEHKVREYLLLLLVEASKQPPSSLGLSKEEWDKIARVRLEISSAPEKRFPIEKLAAGAQMNKIKLMMAFKEKYGKGIFEFQLELRMHEARRLLQETELSTKAVAGIVGYKLTTSLITKFREYFGYPPSQVVKNR